MDLSNFSTVYTIILYSLPIVIIIGIVLLILRRSEKKLLKKVSEEKFKQEKFKRELKKISKLKDPKSKVDALDGLAKRFFKEKLKIKNLSYLEIMGDAKKNSSLEKFSELMLNMIFKGLKPIKKRADLAVALFSEIITKP